MYPGTLPATITHLAIIYYSFPVNSSNLPPNLSHLCINWSHGYYLLPNCFNFNLDSYPNFFLPFNPSPYFWPLDDLPASLTTLYINIDIKNHPLDHLPPALTHLVVETQFNQNICFDHLPESLQHLHIKAPVTVPLDHLPSSLTHLSIALCSSSLDNLPSSLVSLRVGAKIPIDNLPLSLQYLHLNAFELPIDHLPSSLKHLIIGDSFFNQYLDHLPPGLTHLTLDISNSNMFDKPLDNLPAALTHFSFSARLGYSSNIDHLPISLKYLKLPTCRTSLDYLPPALTQLSIQGSPFLDHLPATLTSLSIDESFTNLANHLPASLTTLSFPSSPNFHYHYHHLPRSLTHLNNIRNPFLYHLPKSVISLSFHKDFHLQVTYFPPSIKQIQFGDSYSNVLLYLPPLLTHLTLGENFDYPLPPHPHLAYLVLSFKYKHPLPDLPSLIMLEGTKLPRKSRPANEVVHRRGMPLSLKPMYSEAAHVE